MAKLYPPNISGTLPAFSSYKITIPFSMNRAVSTSEVIGFAIKIKAVNDNSLIYSGEEYISYNLNLNCKVTFIIPSSVNLYVGEFYKIQLAYIGQEVSGTSKTSSIGYFSTVGIAKYTTMPEVYIAGLDINNVNIHKYHYEGVYSQRNGDEYLDTTEKLYSSTFTLYDSKNNIVHTSGEIIHDTSRDTSKYEATEEFKLGTDLTLNESFYLVYSIKTMNGLEANSPRYRISQRRLISMLLNVDLIASLDFVNGAVKLSLKSPEFQIASGDFLISRACSKDGYSWDDFKYFSLASEQPDKKYFMDYTVEQGFTYRYAIQQYNANGVYSNRQLSNDITVDFEDCFLYDGEKQLRIRFNPKVSTFKNDMAETKTETIGSKYPFIFRNGKVQYKEFNISGLISYKMDDVETFGTLEDLGLTARADSIYSNGVTTNLVGYNISAERQFKLQVLEWLTNGEPKIFRSPTEGNYIVRLMNVSFSPNDTLGRMLHTFTCTAYEIAEFNYDNLSTYNLISVDSDPLTVMRWVTIDLAEVNKQSTAKEGSWIKVNDYSAYHVSFTEMRQGDFFGLSSGDGVNSFQIGATGSYMVNVQTPITEIYIKKQANTQGYLTYGYKTRATNTFEMITDTSSKDYPAVQFIGNKILNYDSNKNLLDTLGDIRTSVLHYYYIRFFKRELKTIFVNKPSGLNTNNEDAVWNYLKKYLEHKNTYSFFLDGEEQKSILCSSLLDGYSLYEIRFTSTGKLYEKAGELYYIDKNNDTFRPKTGFVLDCAAEAILKQNSALFSVTVNGERISIEETEELTLPSDFGPKTINFGAGVICELGYQTQITTYNFESTIESVRYAKEAYETALAAYLKKRLTSKASYDEVEEAYAAYLAVLTIAIDDYNRENGVE